LKINIILILILLQNLFLYSNDFINRNIIIYPIVNQSKNKKYDYISDIIRDAIKSKLINNRDCKLIDLKKIDYEFKYIKSYNENKLKKLALENNGDSFIFGEYYINNQEIYINVIIFDIITDEKYMYNKIKCNLGLNVFNVAELILKELKKNIIYKFNLNQKDFFKKKIIEKYNYLKYTDMVYVRGGEFKMGNEKNNNDSPLHTVIISDFYIAKYPVTVYLFKKFIDETGYKTTAELNKKASAFNGINWKTDPKFNWKNPFFKIDDNMPVVCISWYDAINFCNWLSIKEGFESVYNINSDNIKCDFTKNGYRLPTEAEWEYAAHGGKKTNNYEYSGGNNLEDVAWYYDNARNTVHPVGIKKPNELGLYDMTGNVWEWCWDWYSNNYYNDNDKYDPKGPDIGTKRVIRGGSFADIPFGLYIYIRGRSEPDKCSNSDGFRLTRNAR